MTKPKLPRFLLECVVFTSGAVVMILEITGTRILSPYLGTSTFIWTSMIGIILGALSLGYHLGGGIADKKASPHGLAMILFAAAILIGISTDLSSYILNYIEQNFSDIRIASIIAATVLFAPPSVFLGMVSPYAIRLKLNTLKTSGRTVGNLYAISTIGSIVGTFLSGFYLLSTFGSIQLMLLLALVLTLTAATLYRGWITLAHLGFISLIILLLVQLNTVAAKNLEQSIVDTDTEYSRIQIYDHAGIRYMEIGNNQSSAMYLNDPNDLVYDYTKSYNHAIKYFKPSFKKALIIGGGAFSYPKYLLANYPEAQIDVVEIDPDLTEISAEYFALDPNHPNLNIFNQDGRIYLNKTDEKYDIIFGDAFKSFYSVPYQLSTKEAVQAHYDALTEDGIVVLNVAGSITGDSGKFFRAEYRTYQEVFPQVHLFISRNNDPAALQNLIIVASKSEEKISLPYIPELWTEEIPLDMPVLTDNFAPVDQYMMELFDYVKL